MGFGAIDLDLNLGFTLGGDGYIHCLDCGDDLMCIHMSQLIKLHTLNMYKLFYVNYTLIKLF